MSLYFTKEHEWIRVEGDTATIGISHHAQEQLGDIVFAEVPEPLFIESKQDGADFALTLFSTGPKPKSADAMLTIVTDKEAFEAPAHLE